VGGGGVDRDLFVSFFSDELGVVGVCLWGGGGGGGGGGGIMNWLKISFMGTCLSFTYLPNKGL